MNIRDELMRAMADEDGLPSTGHAFFERDYGPYADAILARFPWIAEKPSLQYGHAERKSDDPFDPDFDHVYNGRTPSDPSRWRNVTRYVTPWKEAS